MTVNDRVVEGVGVGLQAVSNIAFRINRMSHKLGFLIIITTF
jgi:hypothetical protein